MEDEGKMEAMVEEGREEANEEEDEDEAEEFGGAEEDEDEEEDEDDLLGTRGEAGGDDLTSSSIATLQRTEDKVVSLLEIASRTATELARIDAGDETRQRLRGHIDDFLSTTQEIHQTLREQINLIPPALPFEGQSYDAKMDFEIAKMQTRIVQAQLGRIRDYVTQQQQEFKRSA